VPESPETTAPAERPERLRKQDVAARLGWANPNNVNVALKRTREGRSPVPFPAPDGHEPIPKDRRVNRITEEPWWLPETIDAYDRLRRHMTEVTDELRGRIHRLRHTDGFTVEEIANRFRISKSTVWRALRQPTTTEGK
jgi:DNA-directed RNA polymerase specialized sigma24 family protein